MTTTPVTLIGGPFDRRRVTLTATPPCIQIGDDYYDAVLDPDTGACLGAYVFAGR